MKESQQGMKVWAGKAGMASHILHPHTMPNKYVIIILNLSFTHSFNHHSSRDSLWYRFLRIGDKEEFLFVFVLPWGAHIKSFIQQMHEFACLPSRRWEFYLAHHVLPADCHKVSMAEAILERPCPTTTFHVYLLNTSCVSELCSLLPLWYVLHLWINTGLAYTKMYKWSRNLVNHLVRSSAFLWR